MRKDLTTTGNTEVALSKSKNFMGVIENIFNNKITVQDDSWMQRLWDWADENNIPDMEWFEDKEYEEGGFWRGLPRDKNTLLNTTKLIFDEIQFTKFPKEIGNLNNLTTLSLRGSQLVELPKEIGNLSNLTMLSLWGNRLTSLPKEIGNLSNLVVLILGENQLTKLPKEIGNLSNLSRLLVWDNQLTQLPSTIGDLTSLSELILNKNLLTRIPKEIENLINLKELQLENNKLKTLPSEIKYLNDLEILVLNDNTLSKLPKEIGEMKNLKELYSKNNLLTKLPDEIINLDTLTDISLKENSIILTNRQKKWFHEMLTSSQAFIFMDDEPLREIYTYDPHENEEDINSHNTYDDIEFNEEQMSVAISRSMASNSDWVFLHTNLNGAIKWLENDGWDKQDIGIYIYPIETDYGKYKKMDVAYDSNGFPILKAELINSYKDGI